MISKTSVKLWCSHTGERYLLTTMDAHKPARPMGLMSATESRTKRTRTESADRHATRQRLVVTMRFSSILEIGGSAGVGVGWGVAESQWALHKPGVAAL